MAVLFTVMGFGLAFTDVLTDAMMVAAGKPRGLTGAFQSVQWAAIYTASVLTGEIGGAFAERRDLRGAFLVAAAFPLLSLVMVAAPHALYLPWWIILVTATLIAWRAYLGYARHTLPGRWMLMLVAAAATIGVFINYRTIFGREAGIALLVLMLGLKFLETRTLRDSVLLIYLGYFLVITNFLRDQTIPVAIYMLVRSS